MNKIFTNFLNLKKLKRYLKYASKRAIFDERFNETIRNLVQKSVFEKIDANWIDVLKLVTMNYNNRVHFTINTCETFSRKNESVVEENLTDKKVRSSPKFEVAELVRTAEKKENFSKGDIRVGVTNCKQPKKL